MALVPGAFNDMLKQHGIGPVGKHHDLIIMDNIESDGTYVEPFPDKLPEVGPETRWQRIWREMWGLMTAEEDWQKRYTPVIKWYRLHYALTRQADEGQSSYKKRFARGWYDFDRDVWHYYVMPLNVIVTALRHVHHLIAYKITRRLTEIQAGHYFKTGYKRGFRDACVELDRRANNKSSHPFPLMMPRSHFKPTTATQHVMAQHHFMEEFEKKQNEIKKKMEQEIHNHLMNQVQMYLGVDPAEAKPYIMQYMNDPLPFPAAIKPQAIEAGAPVGVNHEGKVYALTGVDLAAHLFGFATDKPDDEGFVLVKTSNNAVTKIKAVTPPPSLEAKHED